MESNHLELFIYASRAYQPNGIFLGDFDQSSTLYRICQFPSVTVITVITEGYKEIFQDRKWKLWSLIPVIGIWVIQRNSMIILRYHLSWLTQQHIKENFHRESLGRSRDDSIRETSPGEATRQVRAQQEIPWSGPWATRQLKQQKIHKNKEVFLYDVSFFNWNSFLIEICKSLVFTRLLASLRTYWLQFLPNKIYQTISYIYYTWYIYILYIYFTLYIYQNGLKGV